ncbi:amino acid ABC transporter substrate-binding protein/permease [Arthrobacter sp. zg-Y1171]|uniref:amino acid ABC transporter substrate-binding protein/permease n=1 Tax=Arthrobacter sp. zg-Y1171 TaxID=2964610 RepID=UPI002102635B|nr:amino acid ABC transporter substrate-binding protein/permease [Arthrobacter sp. zg-Y1171]MCQ1995922.1 amino acid ABC transporter substrate-binding protein/permease [Arthrobacter sp. zg-Y1171]UWX82999.1 amino acid ABC transporter substrate-binding protein/permease [Arthrobacter sp. zg-Y1171]
MLSGKRALKGPAKLAVPLTTFLATLALLLGIPAAGAYAADGVEGETFVIGTDTTFAPFEFRENGELVGIDMDLLNAIAEEEGFNVEIQSLGFDAALQSLQSNQVDGVIAGMSITDERRQVFDFSDPYFESGIQMAVAENNNDVKGYEDLRGKRVAVKTGTEGQTFAESIKDQYGFEVVAFAQSAQMYDDVKAGGSVAVFDDYPVLAYGVASGNGLKTVTEKEAGSSYGFAVNKGANPELLTAFNAGLADLKESGEYDEILDTYLEAGAKDSSFWSLITDNGPAFAKGMGLTLLATALSLLFALILGVFFGFLKVGSSKILRGIATVYVSIFRGTPVLVQAFFFYFGLPQIIGQPVDVLTAGVLTLSLNAGAYMTEIVRGGIQSVDPGQMEAARSLGLGYGKTMQKVIIPQAIKIMTPSFINQFVITLKDTSLLAVIGFAELTYQGQQIYAVNFRTAEVLIIVAALYFIVITLLTKLADVLDKRFNK